MSSLSSARIWVRALWAVKRFGGICDNEQSTPVNISPPDTRVSRAGRGWLFDAPWLAVELLWRLYINRSTWKTVYRPFGSIDFHAVAGIPPFRVQRVNSTGIPGSSWLTVIELYFTVSGFGGVNAWCSLCHEPADFLQNILQITGFNVHVCQTSTCCNL